MSPLPQSGVARCVVLGPRTQEMVHQLIHQVRQTLAASYLPVLPMSHSPLASGWAARRSSDGLNLYFYALTAHFGQWVQEAAQAKPVWRALPGLLYAQVQKIHRRRHLIRVNWKMLCGSLAPSGPRTLHGRVGHGPLAQCRVGGPPGAASASVARLSPPAYKPSVCPAALPMSPAKRGWAGAQTAFIERLNLTLRRSLAPLARRSAHVPRKAGVGQCVEHRPTARRTPPASRVVAAASDSATERLSLGDFWIQSSHLLSSDLVISSQAHPPFDQSNTHFPLFQTLHYR